MLIIGHCEKSKYKQRIYKIFHSIVYFHYQHHINSAYNSKSTIGFAECGTWLIFRVGLGTRVKNRSGKRILNTSGSEIRVFERYSMAGYGITISCSRETLSQGRLLISQGPSAILSEMWMMDTSTSPVVVQRRKNSRRTNRNYFAWLEYQHSVELFG